MTRSLQSFDEGFHSGAKAAADLITREHEKASRLADAAKGDSRRHYLEGARDALSMVRVMIMSSLPESDEP